MGPNPSLALRGRPLGCSSSVLPCRQQQCRRHVARVAQHPGPADAAGIADAVNAAAAAAQHDELEQLVAAPDPLHVGGLAAAAGQPYNGQPPPGVSEVGPLPPLGQQERQQQQHYYQQTGYVQQQQQHLQQQQQHQQQYYNRFSDDAERGHAYAGDSSSSSSRMGGGGGGASGAGWQPPRYRRAGIRLRSKRALQAAERAQRTGANLVLDELHLVLAGEGGDGASSSGSPSSSSSSGRASPDNHLEAFIERMLCPQTSLWQRSQQGAQAAQVDGREAVDPDVLAGIASLPARDISQHQESLARRGQLLAALVLMEEAGAAGRTDVLALTRHRTFLRTAGKLGNAGAVLRFMQVLPADLASAATYNLALKACVDSADLRAALRVVDIMGIRQVPVDFLHFTTLISACAAVGDSNQAFAVFQKAKAAEQQFAAAAAAAAAAEGASKKQQAEAAQGAPKMDGQVYGSLIAACAKSIRARSSDMREQLVVLERAFQVLQQALDSGVHLETPAWNALLICAGRCRQLQRCFEVLDLMNAAGVPSNDITFTCLIEAAVLAGEMGMAQRVFARAMAAGVTQSVQLYTAAINACMADDGSTNFDAAFEIYATMQRHGVEPDDLLYGHLIAIAGRCRKLEVAFDLLQDMRASGLKPSTPTCSALIYACLQNNNFGAARKVYDTLIARGVPPHLSQYNTLMEQYALRFQLGNVVSLLTNMVAGGVQPNANTFRILLLACQRTDQAELAFELYQIMKARGLQPRSNNAHSIAFTLLKACFNRTRKGWRPGGYPPLGPAADAPYSNLQGLRPAEARQLLHVLQPPAAPGSSSAAVGGGSGAGGSGGGGGRQAATRRFTFLDNADNINWPLLALSTYRDFISWGYKPHLEVLDKLLACLRLQHPKQQQQPQAAADLQLRAMQLQVQLMPGARAAGGAGAGGALSSQVAAALPGDAAAAAAAGSPTGSLDSMDHQEQLSEHWSQSAAILRDLARERRALAAEERPYEVPFDRRAMDAVGDAIGMGLLPAVKLDVPLQIDMRSFPPMVAEAYVHVLMAALEARTTAAAAGGKRQPVAHSIRLLVPAFDPNYVMWPSYVDKLYVHYSEQLLARQAQLRAEAFAARARANAAAARSMAEAEDGDDVTEDELLLTFGRPPASTAAAAAAAAAAAEAASEGANTAAATAAVAARRRQAAAATAAAAAAASGSGSVGTSWDTVDFGDELTSADFSGYSSAAASGQPGTATAAHGRYVAGSVTGLAVAATFRRLKAYARMDPASGAMKLEPKEAYRWLSAKLRYEEERRRHAREAELAASGYNSTTAYYQQWHAQQQQQQQGGGGEGSWQPPQHHHMQRPAMVLPPSGAGLAALAHDSAAAAAQQQQHAGADVAAGAAAVAAATAGASYTSIPLQQQQPQPQQQFVPGFGPPARGLSALSQQARDIRLGMGPTAALKRPDRAAAGARQQQAAELQQPLDHQQQQQQQQQQPTAGRNITRRRRAPPAAATGSSSSSTGPAAGPPAAAAAAGTPQEAS